MKTPLQISFHDMPVSPALEELIREKTAKLEQFHPNITACRVVVDKPHQHQSKGDQFVVTVEVTLPGATVMASNLPSGDANVAVRDALVAARRQVEQQARRQRGDPRPGARRPLVLDADEVEEIDGFEPPPDGDFEAASPLN